MEDLLFALLGGVTIGVSSTLVLGGLGRIAGISGIYASVLDRPSSENFWKYTFVLGLIIGGFTMTQLYPDRFFSYSINSSATRVIIAGLLVGFGTRLGSGCTSGHGVCGLARLTKRSMVAVALFMSVAVLVVSFEELFL
jgi:hypothetical protein